MTPIDGQPKALDDEALPIVDDRSDYGGRCRWSLDGAHGGLALVIDGDAVVGPEEMVARRMEAVLDRVQPLRVLIDFSSCRHISSSAFGFVVRFFRQAIVYDAQVLAVAPDEHIRGLMSVLGLDAFLLMVEDLDTALAYYRAQGI